MENEREIRQRFEDMVEQYAQQHTNLENMIRKEMHLTDPAEQQDVSSDGQANRASRSTSPMASGAKGRLCNSQKYRKRTEKERKKDKKMLSLHKVVT